MQENEIDIELLELVGRDNAEKLIRLGIQNVEDLIKNNIPEEKLEAAGFTKEDKKYLKEKAEQKEEIERVEKATIGTMFLGPSGENADLLEKLIDDVLRDHIYWRRNFHPEDRFVIQEQDKTTKDFEKNKTKIYQHLYDLLRKLKRSNIPFSSPRYIGHMTGDPLLTGTIGYFAAMLYNPNNVSAEGSPETTDLEIEFGKELAALLGYDKYPVDEDPKTFLEYDPNKAWGHICSGGTIANLEALWVARNLKYLPLAIYRAIKDDPELRSFTIKEKRLSEITAWELLNLSPSEVLELHQDVLHSAKRIGEKKQHTVEKNIVDFSLSSLGMQRFIMDTQEIFKDDNIEENKIKPGVIIVPSTAHYSLAKVTEILGLGRAKEQLIRIPIEKNFRMDYNLLKYAIEHFLKNKIPVIAVVSVCGSTEEGAIDPIHKVEKLRVDFKEKGLSFYHHCDAAFGGYLRCLFRNEDDKSIKPRRLKGRYPDESEPKWPTEGIECALEKISQADSVTIDPHKLGYIPYPAGAVVFKDGRIKWEIAFNPGYLALPFIGSYIVEGSKPGAAAAACWLSTKVFPLNEAGHGTLITRTIKNTYTLLRVMHDLRDNLQFELKKELKKEGFVGEVKLKVLNDPPDMNILCLLINWKNNNADDTKKYGDGLFRMNCFAEAVYNRLKFEKKRALNEHEFIISSTRFKYDEYGYTKAQYIPEGYEHSMQKHLNDMGIKSNYFGCEYNEYKEQDVNCCDDEIFVLRCTIMNPWLAVKPNKQLYYMDEFQKILKDAIKYVLQNPQDYLKIAEEKIKKHRSYWQVKT